MPADATRARPKIGVLLGNLGTPDGAAYLPMWRYLREFLSDRRVIALPRWWWQPILHALVLSTRPRAKGRDYAAIRNRDRDESPLKTVTRAQAQKLQAIDAGLPGEGGAEVVVERGMRYGNPSLRSAVERLLVAGGASRGAGCKTPW